MILAGQLVINGLIAGAVYALVATGFSLIYSVTDILHFAHGVTIVWSAYFVFLFFNILNLSFWVSSFFALFFSVIMGVFMYFVYKRLRDRGASSVTLLIVSVSLLIISESLILVFFGADIKRISFIEVSKGLGFLGVIITPLQLVIIFSSLVLLFLIYFFLKNSKLGKAMRAVSDNKNAAEIVGINSEIIFLYSFVIGSFIAGFASVLIGLEQNLKSTMGTQLMIKGFTGAVIGGIGSVSGAVLGSFLVGLAENLGIWFLPSGWKDAIVFTILFLFLLFKPSGLFGGSGGED